MALDARKSAPRIARIAGAWALVLGAVGPGATAGEIQLVSRVQPGSLSETGVGPSQLDYYSGTEPTFSLTSDDGRYVVFSSTSPNLALGQEDTNGRPDIFLRDRETGTTQLVTHAAGSVTRSAQAWGVPGTAVGYPTVMSADGRFVAFGSLSSDLVDGQSSLSTSQVFLFDRDTSAIAMVTHRPGGPAQGANGISGPLALSSDGRFLALWSNATNLIAGPPGPSQGIYLYDRLTDSFNLASRALGTTGGTMATRGCLSGDGRRVVFVSANLIPGQTGGGTQNFLFDASTGVTSLVTHRVGSPSTGGNGPSYASTISRDGNYVAFASEATDLVASFGTPGSAIQNLYVHSVATGKTLLASRALSSPTAGGDASSSGWGLSRDGRFVAFSSAASNLANGAVPGISNTYSYDRITQAVSLVSRSVSGQPMGGTTLGISLDGARVLFSSKGRDLLPGQVSPTPPNETYQVFLADRASGEITMPSHRLDSPVSSSNASAFRAALSGDGNTVVLTSTATDLTSSMDSNQAEDVFAHQVPTGTTSLVSQVSRASRSGVGIPGGSGVPMVVDANHRPLSGDGRYVLFLSFGSNLMPGQSEGGYNLFEADRLDGEIRLVTHAIGDPQRGTAASPDFASISTDGRYVVYRSSALLAPDADPSYPVHGYTWDRLTGINTLLVEGSDDLGITPDARFAIYSRSGAIYRLERTTATRVLVSRRFGTTVTPANDRSAAATISDDGRFVAFHSSATDLTATSTLGTNVFVFDAETGNNTLVSHSRDATDRGGNSGSGHPALSADGSYVAFFSSATDLVPGQVDTAETSDLFLHDRTTGLNRLVTHTATSAQTAVGSTDAARLSADGGRIAFMSHGLGLVPGQVDADPMNPDVFSYDRLTHQSTLVSHAALAPAAGAGAYAISDISADGSLIFFSSYAKNLIAGQAGPGPDLYLANAFLYDGRRGELSLISGSGSSPIHTGNSGSLAAALSLDASALLFGSFASDLVPDDFNEANDVFVYASMTAPPTGVQHFHTVEPCRLLDTRLPDGQWGLPALVPGYDRSFVPAGRCGIPATAKSLSLNLTVTEASAPGNLRLFAGGAAPFASVINYSSGQTRGNNALVYLGRYGEFTIRCDQLRGSVHVIVDVNGYFE